MLQHHHSASTVAEVSPSLLGIGMVKFWGVTSGNSTNYTTVIHRIRNVLFTAKWKSKRTPLTATYQLRSILQAAEGCHANALWDSGEWWLHMQVSVGWTHKSGIHAIHSQSVSRSGTAVGLTAIPGAAAMSIVTAQRKLQFHAWQRR